MRRRRASAVVLAIGIGVALALGVSVALATAGTAIPWPVFGSGGGTVSSSTNYALGSTAGQPAIGPAGSAGFQLGVGFWYGAAQTDLSVTKSASPNPAQMLNPLTYTVTVNNGGPAGATGVTLTDTLPGAVTFGSATPSQGSCGQAAGVVTCALGSIANGGNATVSIVVTPTTGNSLNNTAAVSGNEPDLTAANNSVILSTPSLWQCTKSDSSVVYRAWFTPSGDDDCDGFTTAIENHIGTDPNVACGGTALPGGSSSTWPVDFNNDQVASLTDIFKMVPGLNLTVAQPPLSGTIPTIRMDLSGDGAISLTDIFKVVPFLNQACAP